MLLNGFDHQVAGHVQESLLGVGGRFILKPLVKRDLFERETSFYVGLQEAPHDTNSAARFTAQYFENLLCCTQAVMKLCNTVPSDGLDRPALPHIVLEDLTFRYRLPNVIDIKMGTETFETTATLKKKEKEVRKYPHQSDLGFRITGFKVFDVAEGEYLCAGKPFGRSVQPSEVEGALALLFSDGSGLIRVEVIQRLLQELEQLLVWMKGQTRHRFFCTSLLVVYDACTRTMGGAGRGSVAEHSPSQPAQALVTAQLAAENSAEVLDRMSALLAAEQEAGVLGPVEPPLVRVKMIDFAHVVEVGSAHDLPGSGGLGNVQAEAGAGCTDAGYVHGLTRLIGHLHRVVAQAQAQQGAHQTGDLQRCVQAMRERARALRC